jgi:hypothetical protein
MRQSMTVMYTAQQLARRPRRARLGVAAASMGRSLLRRHFIIGRVS